MSSQKRRILVFVSVFAAFFILTGCKGTHTPAVFGYVSCDARFNVEFPSRGESVVCSAERAGGKILLTVVTPERSADLRVIASPDGCVIIPMDGGEGIPLSTRAADGLTDVFELLYRGEDGCESIVRSDDGQTTDIIYPDGCVTVGADMLPVAVEIRGDDSARTVVISGYTPINDENN